MVKWRCATDAASILKRRGFTPDTFKVGETVTVTGNLARREEHSCFTRDVVLADGSVINRGTVLTAASDVNASDDSVQIQRTAYRESRESNISGYWWDGDNEEGRVPPLTGGAMTGMGLGGMAELLERFKSNELTAAGDAKRAEYELIYDDPAIHCKMANIIDGMGRDESVNEIKQYAVTITIQYGYMDYFRTIYAA